MTPATPGCTPGKSACSAGTQHLRNTCSDPLRRPFATWRCLLRNRICGNRRGCVWWSRRGRGRGADQPWGRPFWDRRRRRLEGSRHLGRRTLRHQAGVRGGRLPWVIPLRLRRWPRHHWSRHLGSIHTFGVDLPLQTRIMHQAPNDGGNGWVSAQKRLWPRRLHPMLVRCRCVGRRPLTSFMQISN